MQTPRTLQIFGLASLPEIQPGDDLAALLVEALRREGPALASGDILVLAQKIVSKAEHRLVDLSTVTPSPFARSLGERMNKDPRVIEVILRESRRIVRMDVRVLITETHHGFVCANAGVDQSNVPGADHVCLLPLDPDASAARLRARIGELLGVEFALIIADTFGRPWREGLVNVALGVSGLSPMRDYRGGTDTQGHRLKATVIAVADELCSAAELVMGKTAQQPAALIRGYPYEPTDSDAKGLIRTPDRDLFR